MNLVLRASRYVVVIAVIGCLVMFAAVTVFGALAVVQAIVKVARNDAPLSQLATVTVYAFKILDLFLLGTILYIVALGLGSLFLDTKAAMPRWFEVREIQDLKVVLSQSVILVMLVAFLGDVLEWEQGSDILYVGGGIAMVIAAVAFMLRGLESNGSR
jgi:uncharacterized membrane protein YqhA